MKKPCIISILFGVVSWITISFVTDNIEAWDSPIYWTVFYPIAIIWSAYMGYHNNQWWKWGLIAMLSQAMTLVLISSSFTMLPLGIIVFSILSIPLIIAGRLGWHVGELKYGDKGKDSPS